MNEIVESFGDFIRKRREGLRLGLREFCRRNGFDPANHSRLERGLSPPPKSVEIIDSIAIALQLTDDSIQWRTLHQLAAAETGKLPPQLAGDPAKLKRVFGTFDKSGFQWTRALHLESGADLKLFEARIPELVRKLIHFTSPGLVRISAPAGGGIQRPGFDLDVQNELRTPFVPAGRSVWELGTSQTVKTKADDDFNKRTADKAMTAKERRGATYIQVSPRKFTKKEDWRKEKLALKKWKDVRFYDSADLEEWLEIAPPVDAWIAEVFGLKPFGVRSISSYWEELTSISEPPLQANIFLTSRSKEMDIVNQWLTAPASVLLFQHPSPFDPIDFLAACIHSLNEPFKLAILSRAILLESKQAWDAMVFSHYPMLLILSPNVPLNSEQVKKALENRHHVFLSATRLISPNEPLKLSRPLNHELESALGACGFGFDRARKLSFAAGGSLAVLKRLVSASPSSQIPSWSKVGVGEKLIPFVIAGGWNGRNKFDLKMLTVLSAQSPEDLSKEATIFAEMVEPPLLNVGEIWSVVSREDSWNLLARFITTHLLKKFERVALQVLQEDLPKFDLPRDKRWMAGVKAKRARYSDHLKKSIIETLALLNARNDRLPETLQMDARNMVNRVVRRVLSKECGWRRWASLSRHLPDIAEAAPETYLAILKDSIENYDSAVLKLFDETEDAPMGGCLFAGLLWSLETLAWNPQFLTKTCLILAAMDKHKDPSRWTNSPMNSLRTIFLPWLPYTTAMVAQRIGALKKIVEKQPDAGWKLLLGLMPEFFGHASPTHFPTWQNWSSGWNNEFSQQDFDDFTAACAELIVQTAIGQNDRWTQVFEHIERIPEQWRNKLIAAFIEFDITRLDTEKRLELESLLRKTVRRHRDHPDAPWAMPLETIDQLKIALDHVQPTNVVEKHLWLFDEWVELEDRRENGLKAHDEKLESLRIDALREVIRESNIDGVIELAMKAKAPFQIGRILSQLPKVNFDQQLLPEFLDEENEQRKRLALGLAQGRFIQNGWEWMNGLSFDTWTPKQIATIFARIGRLTPESWDLASRAGAEVEGLYWKEVGTWNRNCSLEEAVFITKKFLSVGRPVSAIEFLKSCIRLELTPECDLVATVLENAMKIEIEEYIMENVEDQIFYPIQQLIGYLQANATATNFPTNRLATIEWQYLGLLRNCEVTPKTLYYVLGEEPQFFVDLIRLMFRSEFEDKGKTSGNLTDAQIKIEKAKMENAYHLLRDWNRIPGSREDGTVDYERLMKWVKIVREACKESGHLYVCDSQIGQKLALAPAETESATDRAFPCITVRDVLEEIDSEGMFNGFQIGIFNKRGVVTKSPYAGGELERELQKKYSEYAQQLAIDWPSTAAALQQVADSYRERAKQEDIEAELRKRG